MKQKICKYVRAVKVKILNTNDGKISLSMKAVEDNTQVDEVEKVETAKF